VNNGASSKIETSSLIASTQADLSQEQVEDFEEETDLERVSESKMDFDDSNSRRNSRLFNLATKCLNRCGILASQFLYMYVFMYYGKLLIRFADENVGGDRKTSRAWRKKADRSKQEGDDSGPSISKKLLKSLDWHEQQILRNNLVDHSSLQVGFDDVGGLPEAKQAAQEMIQLPIEVFNQMANAGGEQASAAHAALLRPPSGLLLYGPPGCGKTLLAKAIAKECKAHFLEIAPSSLYSKYLGETNQRVRALFSLAKKMQPCIIFVDEVDGLFRSRFDYEHECNRNMKTEFMQLWEGLGSDQSHSVYIVGATNRPWDLDPGILRRFGRSFMVGLPDMAQRQEVLQIMLKGVNLDNNFSVAQIAAVTEGYTPVDLRELCRVAAQFPLKEAMSRQKKMMKRLQKQQLQQSQQQSQQEEGGPSPDLPPINLRPLMMEDFMEAQAQVAPILWQTQHYRQMVEQDCNQGWWNSGGE